MKNMIDFGDEVIFPTEKIAEDTFSVLPLGIKEYVNSLLGYSINVRGVHWGAASMSLHKLCDEFREVLDEYIDEVVEGVLGGVDSHLAIHLEIVPEIKRNASLILILKDIKVLATDLLVMEGSVGLVSITEAFIQELDKYMYLYKLTAYGD